MSELGISYSLIGLLVTALICLLVFSLSFWRGRIGGEYGRDPYTTNLQNFIFEAEALPDGWLLNVAQQGLVSVSEAEAGGCVVDISRTEGLDIAAANAEEFVASEADGWQRSLESNGYRFNRLNEDSIRINTANDQDNWPTIEAEGWWLNDEPYFRQSNALMVGDGYLLQIGRACQDGDLSPTDAIVKLARFF